MIVIVERGIAMRFATCCWSMLVLLATTAAAEDWLLRGKVVDEAGRPVAGAGVDHLWRANGRQKRPDEPALDMSKEDESRAFWSNEGRMEPLEGTKTSS